MKEAENLYHALSLPVHSLNVGKTSGDLPAELFTINLGGSKAKLLAFVAILRFSGRDIKLYGNLRQRIPDLNIRIPLSCAASEDDIRSQPFVAA